MGQAQRSEERREHRQRVLKRGSIITGISSSEVGCAIRNMHHEGAELKVDLEARVPENFLLYVPADGIGYRATVRWRKAERIGVTFSGTEPKPSWHYG